MIDRKLTDTENLQTLQLRPEPEPYLNSAGWSGIVSKGLGAAYPELIVAVQPNPTAIGAVYEYRKGPERDRNLITEENLGLYRDGRLVLQRVVRLGNASSNVFDADDFLRATVRFALHGANALLSFCLGVNEVHLLISVRNARNLVGEVLGKPLRLPYVCQSKGEASGASLIREKSSEGMLASIREALTSAANSVLSTFVPPPGTPSKTSSPPSLSSEDMARLIAGELSQRPATRGLLAIARRAESASAGCRIVKQ